MDVSIIKPLSHKRLLGKENEILELYYIEKAPMLYISDTYGCSCDYITKWFKSNNLKTRGKDEAKQTKGKFIVKNNAIFGDYKFTHPKLIGLDEEIRRLYVDEQYPVTDLCKLYDIPQGGTFNTWFKRNGIYIRTNKEARNTPIVYNRQIEKLQYKFSTDEVSNIIELYMEGYGAKHIAKSMNLDSCVIFRILKEHDITLRTHKEATNSKITIDMRNTSIIEKYGSWENFKKMQSKIFFEKYGVENPMQLEEHFHTQQKCAKKLKKTIVDGKEISYQGFELLAIHKLIEEGYEISDILNGKGEVPNFIYHFDNKRRRYYPDIFIPKDNRIIEVKSKWTYERELDKNLAKRKAALDGGYKFDFYIMEK